MRQEHTKWGPCFKIALGGVSYATLLLLALLLCVPLPGWGASAPSVNGPFAWGAVCLVSLGILLCTYIPIRYSGRPFSRYSGAILFPGLLLSIALIVSGNPAWIGSWVPLLSLLVAESIRTILEIRRKKEADRSEERPIDERLEDETETEGETETELEPASVDPSLVQQMTRSRTDEGRERIEFLFRAEFPERCATATVHLPFCPAFDRAPRIEAFPLDAAPLKISVPNILPNGVRIDLKRPNDRIAEPETVAILAVVEE